MNGVARRVALTVVVANALFVLVSMIPPPDPELVATRVRTAFATGELGLADWRPWDGRRGWFQYNDCNVLQMLVNRNESALARSFAPIIYKADPDFNIACPVLHALVLEGANPDTLASFQYGRYWHGYNVTTGLALRFLELQDLRRVQTGAIWLAIAALTFTACRAGRRTKLAVVMIAAAVLVFWKVPYFAPGLTRGPGDTLLLLGLLGPIAFPRLVTGTRAIAAYAAAYGSVAVFFEMLTGQLPTGMGWLTALTLAAARDQERGDSAALPVAVTAFVAFCCGAIASVAVKQILVFLLVAPDAHLQFFGQLEQYTALPQSRHGLPGFLMPYYQLLRRASLFTGGHRIAGLALVAVIAALWTVVAVRGWRARYTAFGRDVLFLAAIALLPVFWVMVWPQHTYIHAGFMVRILIVPLSLVPFALLWPRAADSHPTARAGIPGGAGCNA
jgi:hypothetical protein